MKSQFSVLPFADSAVSLAELGKGLCGKNAYIGPEEERRVEFIPGASR